MRRILVVDDTAQLRIGIARLLQHAGYEVLIAEDGVAGLCLLRSHEVHAVILDVYMPRMDGFETMRALRCLAPDLPVVMMSGGNVRLPDYDPLEFAHWLGAARVLYKPFSDDQLVEALAALLEPEAAPA